MLNSKVQSALRGKIAGVPRLTHLALGQRKVVPREWLHEWIEENKAS